MFDQFRRYEPQLLAVLRIVAALLFIQHGTNKLFAWPDVEHGPGMMVLFGRVGVIGLLETFGGLAILLGLFTRPVAFLLAGEMAVAFWWIHFGNGLKKPPLGIFPVNNGGDLAILFCFVFLFLVAAGPGCWSLDALRGGKSGATARSLQ